MVLLLLSHYNSIIKWKVPEIAEKCKIGKIFFSLKGQCETKGIKGIMSRELCVSLNLFWTAQGWQLQCNKIE